MAAVESAIDKQLKPYADLIDTITIFEPNSEAKKRVFWRSCKVIRSFIYIYTILVLIFLKVLEDITDMAPIFTQRDAKVTGQRRHEPYDCAAFRAWRRRGNTKRSITAACSAGIKHLFEHFPISRWFSWQWSHSLLQLCQPVLGY